MTECVCLCVFCVYLSTGNTKRDSYKDVQLLFSAVDIPCSYSLKEKSFSQREIIPTKRNFSQTEKALAVVLMHERWSAICMQN